MKIDLTQLFYSPNGEVMKEKGKEVTLGQAITNALLSNLESDRKKDGNDKAKVWALWHDKIKDQEKVDLKAEEIVTIKKRVGEAYGISIVGQVYKYLDK